MLVVPAIHAKTRLVTGAVQFPGVQTVTVSPVPCYRENNYGVRCGESRSGNNGFPVGFV